MRRKLVYAGVLCCCVLLGLPVHAASWHDTFEQQTEHWIQQISESDPDFHSWQEASHTKKALGPNLKQWLVTLRSDAGHPIGYMVIGEKPDTPDVRFVLLEYGAGNKPLFDEERLSEETVRRDKEAVYAGLQSHWALAEDTIIDAKTGETFPKAVATGAASTTQKAKEMVKRTRAVRQLLNVMTSGIPSYQEPMAHTGWLQPEQQNVLSSFNELKDTLTKERVTYVAEHYEGQVLAPYTVRGLHRWQSFDYVALEDEGVRVLPYTVLHGDFIRH